MAMNKTAGESRVKAGMAPKKAAKKSPAKKAALKKAPAKKAAVKKKAAPKLTEPQKTMFDRVHAHTDPAGFHSEKKPEQKVLEALVKHRLLKRAKKHPQTKHYHYHVTTTGKKYKAASSSPAANVAPK
jgi:hypothetical protein